MSLEQRLARVIEEAVAEGLVPGAVALVGRGDEVLCHAAFGERAADGSGAPGGPMRPDTVFDLASLTKPLTATAVMQLVEAGEALLQDPLSRFIPAFTGEGREAATLRHLLTHSAGVQPYRNYLHEWGVSVPAAERRARVVQDICALSPQFPPGEGFAYSCMGYVLLASVVEAVSGLPVDRHIAERICAPLGMSETCFNPGPDLLARCAPTEQLPEGTLVGVVHDEAARYLGGVGGNAGAFSTAKDYSRFIRAILNGGALNGARILAPATVAVMTSPHLRLPGVLRALGWDMDTSYSPQVRGDLFPAGSFGHTGYTGTSVWADPASRAYVILLTNRVHLGRDRDISRLRRQVSNIAAAAAIR